MRNIYAVLFRDKKLIVKTKNEEEMVQYSLDNAKVYPNVPFYSNLFQDKIDINTVGKCIKDRLKQCKSKIELMKPLVFVLMPDDITDVDKRAIQEFTMVLFKPKEVLLVCECVFSAPVEEQDYICIYKSCRMIVITYVKEKDIKAQKFIENKDYTIDEIKRFIYNLHEDCMFNKLRVYLNGEDVSKYAELGKIVERQELLNNVLSISSLKLKKKRMYR